MSAGLLKLAESVVNDLSDRALADSAVRDLFNAIHRPMPMAAEWLTPEERTRLELARAVITLLSGPAADVSVTLRNAGDADREREAVLDRLAERTADWNTALGRTEKAEAALGEMRRRWTVIPDGKPVRFDECPPGPFLFGGEMCFKSEYGEDAYCSTGEAFWGGTGVGEVRAGRIVQPCRYVTPASAIQLTDPQGMSDGALETLAEVLVAETRAERAEAALAVAQQEVGRLRGFLEAIEADLRALLMRHVKR